jgi:hypothetical protein
VHITLTRQHRASPVSNNTGLRKYILSIAQFADPLKWFHICGDLEEGLQSGRAEDLDYFGRDSKRAKQTKTPTEAKEPAKSFPGGSPA